MMDDEPKRMDPRCDAGGRGYMLWTEHCNDGEYVRATDYDALAAKLAEVEAERDAFASNIPDAAQNLIRNAHIGRLKALHRAKAAEAELAHLENHIEATAKDTHKIMVDLTNPLDDPRVKALVEAGKAAEAVLAQYYVGNKAIAKRKLRKALSALEKNK